MPRLTYIHIITAAILLLPTYTSAQSSPTDDRTKTSTEAEQLEDGETKTDKPPKRPGVKQFDDVTVKRVRPEALPPASNTEIPDVLRGRANQLPSPPDVDELEKTGNYVERRVYELISFQRSKAPGESTPIIHRGHAVVVSTEDGETPILLTTYFWLKKTERLFIVPRPNKSNEHDDGTPSLAKRSVEELTIDGGGDQWLKEHGDKLVEAKLYKPDKHRNLVTVVPSPPDALDLPKKGLELFDLENKSPTRLYGYSPETGDALAQTRLLESHPDKEALVYYLQTEYPAVFGAPIVSTDGNLLVLTAFRHPDDQEITLVIPPAPIAKYIQSVLADL